MRLMLKALLVFIFIVIPAQGFAGFTETLPKSTWLVDASYNISTVESMWNDDCEQVPLIEEMVRYEAGAGKQGILKPNPKAELGLLAIQLHYGILDNLTFGFGIPIMLYSKVDPRFEWEEGDYQWNLGRPYSETDFWQWAESMGQPRPETWEGNKGVLGDILLGLRYRFTDKSEVFRDNGLAMALLITAALPTGRAPDPELVVTTGTTSWDLHFNGDLGFRLGLDKTFKESLDGRLTLGVEAFYEFLFPHEYKSPTGKENPLMLNYAPYIGDTYTIDGGDFSGGSFQVDLVPYKGPALGTWLVGGDVSKAEALPPMITFSFRYTFLHLQQSNWESDSALWDWEKEEVWKPGYKNILWGQMVVSLLRIGAPIQPYVGYRNLTWIPGKNARAPNVLNFGTRFLLKFW